MAPGEKENAQDRAMRRLLAQTLRQGLEPGGDGCPGPETLAAYYDRSLRHSERARCELHVSNCARCQQVLAALAASEAGPMPVRETQRVTVIHRYLSWRWLAPAAAAAAAVALWIAIRPAPLIRQASHVSESEKVARLTDAGKAPAAERKEMAQNNAPLPPKLALESKAKTESAASARVAELSPAKPKRMPREVAPRAARDEFDRAKLAKRADTVAAPAPTPAAGVSEITAATSQPALAQEKDKADQKRTTQPSRAEQVAAEHEFKVTEAGKLAPAKPEPEAPAAGYSVAPGREVQKETPKKRAENGYRAASGQPQSRPATMMLRLVSPSTILIASSNPSVFWRVGPGGKIERSRDSSKTWQVQESHVAADLLAGSAPSETVCWVVGRAGTILRTTDGQHWKKISSPAPLDWTGVEARDALHATVFAADHLRYLTEDGGRSWRTQ